MKALENMKSVSLLAGVVCYFFAFFLIVLAPGILTNADEPYVVDVDGNTVKVADYTPQEQHGRDQYIEQVCWHCHSQFVRPVNDEDLRWGPVSQPGESVIDTPHLYGTRRIGPDLAREGWRRVDDWHYAHFYNPRYTVTASVMPGFTWMFHDHDDAEEIQSLVSRFDTDGDGLVSIKDGFDKRPGLWTAAQLAEVTSAKASKRIDNSGVLAPTRGNQESDGSDLVDAEGNFVYDTTWSDKNVGDALISNYDGRPRPLQGMVDLVAYLQRLGTSIGKWRKPVEMGTPMRGFTAPMRGVETEYTFGGEKHTVSIADGRIPQRHYEARLYGLARDNNDPANQEARTLAEKLSAEYDALMGAWRKENPEWARRLDGGHEIYMNNCAGCHGDEGRGNGPAADFLRIRPRDFTFAKYRYRSTGYASMPLDGDIYRSLHRGLPGSSMPHWYQQLSPDQIWLLVDYLKSLRESRGGNYGAPWNDTSAMVKQGPVPRLPKDPEYLDQLYLRGKAVYNAIGCVKCHGTEGDGAGPSWNGQAKPNGGLVRPRRFIPRNANDIVSLRFRGGASPEDLYRTIHSGLAGANMPPVSFDDVFNAARKVQELKDSGADAAAIEAAEKAARWKLEVALPDEIDGVITEEVDGKQVQYIEMPKPTVFRRGTLQAGDDWALVYFVMRTGDIDWPYWLPDEE